jgi:hypothetical protein
MVDQADAVRARDDAGVVGQLHGGGDVLVFQGLPVPPLEIYELALDRAWHRVPPFRFSERIPRPRGSGMSECYGDPL